MKNENELKQIVKEKYGQIAKDNSGCGCSCGCAPTENAVDFSIMKKKPISI
jgi:hypothetical protein